MSNKVDWSQYPWWVRPALAVGVGLAIGLVLGGILNLVSVLAGTIVVLILCAMGLGFCLWALWDLRKMKRNFAYEVEQLEETGRLPRGTPQRRRSWRRWS